MKGLGKAGERELGYVHLFRGSVLGSQGDRPDAIAAYEQALRCFEMAGDDQGVAHVLRELGWTAVREGDASRAQPLLERSLALYQELGDLSGVGAVSGGLGDLYAVRGDLEEARLHYERHLAVDEALQFWQGMGMALANLSKLHRLRGDYAQARRYGEAARKLSRRYDMPWHRSVANHFLAMLALHEDDLAGAKEYFTAYYREAPADTLPHARLDLLFGFAAIAAASGEAALAARLSGAAQRASRAAGYRVSVFSQAELDRHLARARAQLGEDAFAALAEEGSRMGVEEAVAYALGEQGI